MVDKIDPGSVAALAKLREGDVIVAIDGMDTPNPLTLVQVLKAHSPGDTIHITYIRNSNQYHAQAVLTGGAKK